MPALTRDAHLKRLKELIARLKSGVAVQPRDIDTVLSKKQQQAMADAWEEQKELRAIEKPSDVLEYEKKLTEALLLYGKADQSATPTWQKNSTHHNTKSEHFQNKAVNAFEDALESLQEMIDHDPSLRIWFDRNIDFSPQGDLSTDPDGMPRVVTSRSRENRSSVERAFGWKSKSEVKIEALESALAQLEAEMASPEDKKAMLDADAAMKKRLKAKLAGLKGHE